MIIDEEILSELRQAAREDSPKVFEDLGRILRSDGIALLSKIEQAATRRDFELLRSTAHGMKSTASGLQARNLLALCAELEKQSDESSVSDLERLIEQLTREFEKVCVVIEQEHERFQTSPNHTDLLTH